MRTYLDELRGDLRYGLRWCWRTPGFTLAAVLSLALGIGANTAIFSLLDTVLLRALPVRQPEQLVVFSLTNGKDAAVHGFSYGFLQRVRHHDTLLHDGLAEVIASSPRRFSVDLDGHVEPTIAGQFVSGNYFGALGVPMALGRPILPEDDDAPGAHPVAVLSYTFWESRFARDPNVLGRTIRLNGYPFTIIGVTPPEFFGLRVGEPPQVAIPLTMQQQAMPDVNDSWLTGENDNQPWLELTGRLKPGTGTGASQVEAELRGLYQQYFADDIAPRMGPKAKMLSGWYFALEPGSRGLSEMRQRFSRPLGVLMAIVALVLLIACANVANLLLARAAARQREVAVRVSLGAGRARLIRQLLTESLLIAALGAACGLLFAQWGSQALAGFLATQPGQHLDVRLDLRVLLFTALVAIATGILFGIAPALGAARVEPQAALKDSASRTLGSRSGMRFGKLLVGAQMTLSLWLLVGAGLFVQTLMNLQHVDLGFEREHLLSLRLEPRGSDQKHRNGERLNRMYVDLADRVRAVPGVRAVSLAGSTPLVNENILSSPIRVEGYVPSPGEDNVRIRLLQIYPEYFATLGVSMAAGREFSPADNDINRPRVAIVNETLARRYFGSAQGAIDRALRMTGGGGYTFRIIGVARDVRDEGPREAIAPLMYSTYAHTPTGRGQMTLLVRAAGDTRPIAATLRQYARALDPDMPLRDVQTIADRLDNSLRQEQLIAWLSGCFGGLALLLACVGLYGVMAYAVARRTGEFGIRLALGARRADVAWLVMRDVLIVLAAGIVIGLPIAWASARFVSHMLFGLAPGDPGTVLIATVVLAAVALVSGYVPTRQAARVDPLIALRHE